MSRRTPNPAAERAAQNQQTIKTLLKLEANKICADCKRNKHPRWASWNLGVFICIRCSGIHRGMGTHISRVKSVDLDSWTDEQLQSILSWGNARANKYWEHKLATGHMPSESKMENFIRTKYELKRWTMDGPIPDPASLDADGDDDIPLSIVKEKQNIDRKESIRKSGASPSGSASVDAAARAAARSRAPVVDLFGGGDAFPSPPPPRATTAAPAGPAAAQVAPKGAPVPPKASSGTTTTTSNTRDSLLGLDFLGSPAAPARPSSTVGSATSGGQSRPDLKQSILSLYATAPRTQPPPAQHAGATAGGFGGLHSPSLSQNSFGSLGGPGALVDPFSNLSFSTAPATSPSPKPVDAFSGLASLSGSGSRPNSISFKSGTSAFGSLGGGGFFESKPAAPAMTSPTRPTAAAAASSSPSSSAFGGLGGFGAFSSAPAIPTAAAVAAPAAASNAFADLFDFSPAAASTTTPAAAPASSFSPPPAASGSFNSVFNLSAQPAKPTPTASAAAAAPSASPLAAVSANWSNSDVWGNDGWGASAAPAAVPAATSSFAHAAQSSGLSKAAANDFGWGSAATTHTPSSFATQSIVPGANGGFATAPKVAADEEFGGWTSSTATTTTTTTAKPAAGFGGSEDLFSNVWG